jgi:hypothetical protein
MIGITQRLKLSHGLKQMAPEAQALHAGLIDLLEREPSTADLLVSVLFWALANEVKLTDIPLAQFFEAP